MMSKKMIVMAVSVFVCKLLSGAALPDDHRQVAG